MEVPASRPRRSAAIAADGNLQSQRDQVKPRGFRAGSASSLMVGATRKRNAPLQV